MKKNGEVIIQIGILAVITLLLVHIMITGKINYYIHPRYHMGIWFSIGILLLFMIRLLFGLKTARHNVNVKPYFLFLFPVLIAFFSPTAGISKEKVVLSAQDQQTEMNSTDGSGYSAANKDEAGRNDREIEDSYKETADNVYNQGDANQSGGSLDGGIYEESSDSMEEVKEPKDKSEKYTGKKADGATIIEDDYFASWYYDLYDYLDDFIGKRYQFLAQVYSMEDLKENEFLAGRIVMVCCAADASAYGLICESKKAAQLKDKDWITITGTIEEGEYNGARVPKLGKVVITKAKAPKDEYVYYNFY